MSRITWRLAWTAQTMFLAVALLGGSAAEAQTSAIPARVETYPLASGWLDNSSDQPAVIFDRVVDMGPGVPWIQVRFSAETALPPGTSLRISSLLDGDSQLLDAVHLESWGYRTAYFNGGAVRIELLAGPGTEGSFVGIDSVVIGERDALPQAFEPAVEKEICGMDDDRTLAEDAAIGRLVITRVVGMFACTGFITGHGSSVDRCQLSAGHCFDVLGPNGAPNPVVSAMLQFEVPESDSNCALRQPDVDKQFPVLLDKAVEISTGIGTDWAVFRTDRNTSGEWSFEEQGEALRLAESVVGGDYKVTGYGADGIEGADGGGNTPCECKAADMTGRRNSVLQTDKGPSLDAAGTELRYAVDACGGGSGSPVLGADPADPDNSLVVGIHNRGGCESHGYNVGTAITHPDLQTAICDCESFLNRPPKVPTLSRWGLAAAALLLLAAAWMQLRHTLKNPSPRSSSP